MNTPASAREHYLADGGLPVGLWPAFVAAPIGLALLCGELLHQLLLRGWYVVILAPALTALALGIGITCVVALAHCRKVYAAAAMGAFSGLLMYLSAFYFGMVHELPPGSALRFDLLPKYVSARLHTDRGRELGRAPAPNQQAKQPDFFGNCLAFSIELALSLCLPAAAAAIRARRPYLMGRWMAREERRLPAGLYAEFQRAFDSAALSEFVDWLRRDAKALAKAQIAKRYASCILEYVRHPRRSPLEFPIYLTFVNDAANFWDALFRRHSEFKQIRIEPEEVNALRPLFPNLSRILTAFPDAQKRELEEVASGNVPGARVNRALEHGVMIHDVPRGGTLRSRKFLLIINLLGLIPLVTFFGGIGLIALGGWGWWHGWGVPASVGLILIGAISFTAGGVQAQRYGGLMEGWYARRRLASIVALRGDAIVPANDPAADTVNLTRRENWLKVQLDVRDDIGLLLVDEQRREVRIEGDKRRYTIPFSAIVTCQPECFHHPLDKQLHNQYWYIRMAVPSDGQERELFFAPLFKDWRPRTNENRRAIAQEFCRRMAQLTS